MEYKHCSTFNPKPQCESLLALTFVLVFMTSSCSNSNHSSEFGTVTGGIIDGGAVLLPQGYNGGKVSVQDHNNSGHVLMSITVRSGSEYHLSLPPGSYLLKAYVNGQTCSRKVDVLSKAKLLANITCNNK